MESVCLSLVFDFFEPYGDLSAHCRTGSNGIESARPFTISHQHNRINCIHGQVYVDVNHGVGEAAELRENLRRSLEEIFTAESVTYHPGPGRAGGKGLFGDGLRWT